MRAPREGEPLLCSEIQKGNGLADHHLAHGAIAHAHDVQALLGMADALAVGGEAGHFDELASLHVGGVDAHGAAHHFLHVGIDEALAVAIVDHGGNIELRGLLGQRVVLDVKLGAVALHLTYFNAVLQTSRQTRADAKGIQGYMVVDETFHIEGPLGDFLHVRVVVVAAGIDGISVHLCPVAGGASESVADEHVAQQVGSIAAINLERDVGGEVDDTRRFIENGRREVDACLYKLLLLVLDDLAKSPALGAFTNVWVDGAIAIHVGRGEAVSADDGVEHAVLHRVDRAAATAMDSHEDDVVGIFVVSTLQACNATAAPHAPRAGVLLDDGLAWRLDLQNHIYTAFCCIYRRFFVNLQTQEIKLNLFT